MSRKDPRAARAAPGLALATLLLLGLAPARAAGAELQFTLPLFDPDSHTLRLMVLFDGRIAADGPSPGRVRSSAKGTESRAPATDSSTKRAF